MIDGKQIPGKVSRKNMTWVIDWFYTGWPSKK